MKKPPSGREWLGRSWRPLLLVGLFLLASTAFVNAAMNRSLGATRIWKPGQPMSFGAEVLVGALEHVPAVFLIWLLFAIGLGFARGCFRWWVMLASIWLLATPMAFFAGRAFARYVSCSQTQGGEAWEEIVATVVGSLVAFFVGLVADAVVDYLQRVRGDKWAALPSFGVVYVLSLGVLLAFGIWIFIDASFPHVLEFILTSLRPGRYVVTNLGAAHAWDVLGSRVAVLCPLIILAGMSHAGIILRLFVGKGSGRSIRSIMFTTALVAAWLSLFVSYDSLKRSGMQFRVQRALPHFKLVARHLVDDWPVENGSLPELGEYMASASQCPDRVFLPNAPVDGCFFRETFGPLIWRLPRGGLLFSVLPETTEWEIQYCPDNQVSCYHVFDGTRYNVVETMELEPCWYLTRRE